MQRMTSSIEHDGSLARIDDGHCGGGALRASVTHGGGGNGPRAVVISDVIGVFTHARLSFSFRGPKAVGGTYVELGCSLGFRPQNDFAGTEALVQLDNASLHFSAVTRDANGAIAGTTPPRVQLDGDVSLEDATRWRTLEMELEVSSAAIHATVALDGQRSGEASFGLFVVPTRVRLDCGILYADQGAATHVIDIDDVFVELCP